MSASSPRDPLNHARMTCGELPLRFHPGDPNADTFIGIRAMDHSEPFDSPPVQPSIRHDHLEPSGIMRRIDARIAAQDAELSRVALLLHVIDALLELLATDGVSLDTFRTDHRECASVKRSGNTYEVRRLGS